MTSIQSHKSYKVNFFVSSNYRINEKSEQIEAQRRKSPRLNPFQYKVVEDTVSILVYGRPESGSTSALLGSTDMPFSPPTKIIVLLFILFLLERTRQAAVEQWWHDWCQQTQVPMTNLFIQKYLCSSFPFDTLNRGKDRLKTQKQGNILQRQIETSLNSHSVWRRIKSKAVRSPTTKYGNNAKCKKKKKIDCWRPLFNLENNFHDY